MFIIHAFVDGKKRHLALPYLPRCGDTIRFGHEQYGIVKEVVWCLDETDDYPRDYQRINLRIEMEKNKNNVKQIKTPTDKPKG